jgi:hypothetical protein
MKEEELSWCFEIIVQAIFLNRDSDTKISVLQIILIMTVRA